MRPNFEVLIYWAQKMGAMGTAFGCEVEEQNRQTGEVEKEGVGNVELRSVRYYCPIGSPRGPQKKSRGERK